MPRKIRKRANGKYTLTVYDGYDGNGKQVIRSKTVQAASMKDVRRLYAEFENEVRSGRVVYGAGYKLQEFAETWLKEYCEKNLAPKTVEIYRKQLKIRIIPAFGSRRLTEITPMDVIYFINRLKTKPSTGSKNKKPASDQVASQCFYVLSSMLQDAMEWQLIGNNPCASVPRPKVKRTKMKLPEMDGIMEVVHAVRNEKDLKKRTMFSVAIATGLRRGELNGLKWTDVNLDTGRIDVKRAVQEVGHEVISKEPKTAGSVRSLYITGAVLELLKQYHQEEMARKEELSGIWDPGDWVFTQWNGKVINPGTVTHWWIKFIRKNNLPHIPFHGLRHMSATILIAEGVPLKNVSARLGHTDIRTTANIYADALETVDIEAAAKMDEYLSGKKDG